MTTHDFVGIGLGPFNLGLACLTDPLRSSDDLDGVFLEARDRFSWHPGMLLDDAPLQVPFLADLVTMADPTSRWSFLSYLKQAGHLYPFYIRESFYPLRKEYDDYCRWAAERLPSVRFGQQVTGVEHDGTAYLVTSATGETYRTRRLVLGIGTSPRVPDALRAVVEVRGAPATSGPVVEVRGAPATSLETSGTVTHSADYLARKAELQRQDRITVVGSGQSAAEVYQDLLAEAPDHGYELVWLTRSPRFFPMEYTKLTLEMTSPEYGEYHRRLPIETRDRLAREQRHLFKGISGDLVDAIFDLHYQQRVSGVGPNTTLLTHTEVRAARPVDDGSELDLLHVETGERFSLTTGGLVLATGYAPTRPAFLEGIRDRIRYDARGRYDVAADYSVDVNGGEVFVQNAEEHTHSLLAPDLGMGPYRNSVIVAAMLGREVYPVEKRIAVQTFGVPDHLKRAI
ncbi:lysine N(6)-hydroxylase/L-ornithine N(5)-oxygenase family protein [Nocardioides daeguensis]|uniref:Lysine N(6)-hydroxylase/L-ornithine N(5)-oxygenase family protein n=1 Tax=Nocardioides daeguensis TaxID=908359 RepID=A0ABP6VET1_9ACTN|nr:SidA/IucD/PvdA family monooxygenase [Nocardioides daeguensis]MBV6728849.1 SidA/IucD/PvdA family monooxygenase [Nocardioides daeguensis]MCR1773370.1 SidA/IucD/PvdA family monooxygenase [Nocardioides daeguensis]